MFPSAIEASWGASVRPATLSHPIKWLLERSIGGGSIMYTARCFRMKSRIKKNQSTKQVKEFCANTQRQNTEGQGTFHFSNGKNLLFKLWNSLWLQCYFPLLCNSYTIGPRLDRTFSTRLNITVNYCFKPFWLIIIYNEKIIHSGVGNPLGPLDLMIKWGFQRLPENR